MAYRYGIGKRIHSDYQTTFHKAAKVFKAPTLRMQLVKVDPTVVKDILVNQSVSSKITTERVIHFGGHWQRVCRQHSGRC